MTDWNENSALAAFPLEPHDRVADIAETLRPLFGHEAPWIAEHIAAMPPAREPYPLLSRAIRYALADGMH